MLFEFFRLSDNIFIIKKPEFMLGPLCARYTNKDIIPAIIVSIPQIKEALKITAAVQKAVFFITSSLLGKVNPIFFTDLILFNMLSSFKLRLLT